MTPVPNGATFTTAPLRHRFSVELDASLHDQDYDHPDLPAMRAGFDEGLVDIGDHLVARFGGRVIDRYLEGVA